MEAFKEGMECVHPLLIVKSLVHSRDRKISETLSAEVGEKKLQMGCGIKL
jgi:hypothetical protein